jgi:hypothetical protein
VDGFDAMAMLVGFCHLGRRFSDRTERGRIGLGLLEMKRSLEMLA